MKVLTVNTYDITGGAAQGAYRLHKNLPSMGVQSEMLVQFKDSADPTVAGPRTKLKEKINWLHYHIDKLPLKFYPRKNKPLFSPAWVSNVNIVNAINKSDADIVHFHWIADGMMSINDIGRIRKPVVWSLHDMWAFTGGCHYDGGCGRYTSQCLRCPVLSSKTIRDLSYNIFRKKMEAYAKIPSLTPVGLSRWIAKCAEDSAAFSGRTVVNIPSLIDTNVFRPLDNAAARDLLDLPQDKKLILFGGDGMVHDPRKGYRELNLALNTIKTKNVELLIFGSGNFDRPYRYKFPTHYLGHLPNDLQLRIAYSAADVVVIPSLQENLAYVIMAGLACGTPVVAFNIGGNPDMIHHQENGYLAAPGNSISLADGIDWILGYPEPEYLSKNARASMEIFELTTVTEQYRDLYLRCIEQ